MDPAIEVSDYGELLITFTILAIVAAMLLEAIIPRRTIQQSVGYRWINNLSLAAVTYYISTIAKNGLLLGVVWYADLREFGLLQRFDIGIVGSFIVLLLAAQGLGYVIHRLMHAVPWLWRLHAIHHNDTEVDVSTAYRHNPIETIITLPIVIPALILLGAPVEAAVIYQLFFIGTTVFGHSNIYLPPRLERLLGYLIVTPDFHRNHHCSDRRFTDSNYSSIVPWFDYLFGTATRKPFEEHATMELGLDYLRDPRDSRLDQMLILPFKNWKRIKE